MIAIKDLHFAYRRKPVINGLSLELQPGFIYGLLGRNGIGKTTLLHNLAGLLFPQKGRIQVGGFEPRHRQPAFLKETFFVPEEFYLPPVRVAKWARSQAPFYPKFSFDLFDKTLKEFDIPADIRLTELSHGQKKKAFVSFALSTNTAILLMDEPTNGLDIISKSQFRKVIAGSLNEDKCILISTHQVKDLENLIDKIAVLDDGKIVFDQSIDAISRKLQFKLSFDPEELAGALYAETSLHGDALVLPAGKNAGEGHPDLEMLYKAIVLQKDRIEKIFNH